MSLSNKHSFWWKKGHFYIFELSVLGFFLHTKTYLPKVLKALKVCDLFLKIMEQTPISQWELWILFRSRGLWALVEIFSWKQKEQSFPLVDSSSFVEYKCTWLSIGIIVKLY